MISVTNSAIIVLSSSLLRSFREQLRRPGEVGLEGCRVWGRHRQRLPPPPGCSGGGLWGPCFADGLPRQGHPGLGSPAPPRGRLSPARCLARAVSRTELRVPAPLCLRVRPGCSGCPGQAAPTRAAQGPLSPHAITATVPRAPGAIASAVAPLSLGHEARRFSLGRFCSLCRRGLCAGPPGPRSLPQGMRWPRVEGEPLASRAPRPWQAGPPPRVLQGPAAGAAAGRCPPDVSGARGARGVTRVPQAVRRRQDGQ